MGMVWANFCNIFLLSALSLGLLSTACAPPVPQQSYVRECILPEDQAGTISGRWPIPEVPVAFFQPHLPMFLEREITAMVSAAETWNKFYGSTRGFDLVNIGTQSQPLTANISRPDAPCSQDGLIMHGRYEAPVMLYMATNWPYKESGQQDIIALTSFCFTPEQPINRFYMAMLEFNYQYFFQDGTKQPDVESIMLHELGHLIGLDHSCEGSPKPGMPNCSQGNIDRDYLDAILYPIIQFPDGVNGEARRSLRRNDMGRANCLYDPAE
jgi:hypothetical protein